MSEQSEPRKSHIPEFRSYEEEADWWDSTDTGDAEYEEEFRQPGREHMKKELLIVSDPRIMVGKPIIKGTRITVEHIVRELA